MITNRLFKEPLTDTQLWSVNMFTNSLRVLVVAVLAIIASVLTMIYTLLV